jgi:thiol-disulfide isomerase/thioredoxin
MAGEAAAGENMGAELNHVPLAAENPVPPAPPRRGGRDAAVIAVVVVAVAAMIWAAVRFSHRVAAPGSSSGPVASVHELEGKPAPAFTLKTLEGATANLADYRGKAVMIDFWATWCGPCRIEMPWFPEIQKKYGPQGFTILAINMDDGGIDLVKKFAKDFGVNYPILMGSDAVADAYGVTQGYPTNVFIDRDGRVIAGEIGLTGQRQLEANIQRALASGSANANAGAPGR